MIYTERDEKHDKSYDEDPGSAPEEASGSSAKDIVALSRRSRMKIRSRPFR